MKTFAKVYKQLDQSTLGSDRVAILAAYFNTAPPQDRLWAIALLMNRKPEKIIKQQELIDLAFEHSQLPQWLFDYSIEKVEDKMETIALVFPTTQNKNTDSLKTWMNKVRSLHKNKLRTIKEEVLLFWQQNGIEERYLFNKIITASFFTNIKDEIIIKSLSIACDISEQIIAQRLNSPWSPEDSDFYELFVEERQDDFISTPYPWEEKIETTQIPVGFNLKNHQYLTAWDGIPIQFILRKNQLFLWSSEQQLLNKFFPEIDILKHFLDNGIVITGTIVAYDGNVLPYQQLKQRLKGKGKTKVKSISKKAVFFANDLLEINKENISSKPYHKRRELLQKFLSQQSTNNVIRLNPTIQSENLEELDQLVNSSRKQSSLGILLQDIHQKYPSKAILLKAKKQSILGILTYVVINNRNRKTKELSLAVKNFGSFVPIVKLPCDLTKDEQEALDLFVKNNTIAKYGPARTITAEFIFEVAFDGVFVSQRHKAGLALRSPELVGWRKDKAPDEAHTLQDLRALL